MRKIFFIILSILSFYTWNGNAWAQVTPWQIAQQAAAIYQGGSALLSFLEKSNKQAINPDFVLQVLENAHSLQERGLPPGPYLLKANEGLAKGVPPGQMQRALHHNILQLEEAQRLSDAAMAQGLQVNSPEARRSLIQQYQWALLNGISPAQLRVFSSQFLHQEKNRSELGLRQKIHSLTKTYKKKDVQPKKEFKDKSYKKPKSNSKPNKKKFKDVGKSPKIKAKHEKKSDRVKPGKAKKSNSKGRGKGR